MVYVGLVAVGEGNGNPLQYSFLPGKFYGWRSLVGYSPWGRKESDMTERLQCPVARDVKSPPANSRDMRDAGLIPGPLEEMAAHSSTLAWRIPRTEEPLGLRSLGAQSQTPLKQLSMHKVH